MNAGRVTGSVSVHQINEAHRPRLTVRIIGQVFNENVINHIDIKTTSRDQNKPITKQHIQKFPQNVANMMALGVIKCLEDIFVTSSLGDSE